MKELEVIQVIRTTLLRRGRGIDGDPIRCITQYWSIDGDLLWEIDPMKVDEIVLERRAAAGVASR